MAETLELLVEKQELGVEGLLAAKLAEAAFLGQMSLEDLDINPDQFTLDV